jgi:hypothetical protein
MVLFWPGWRKASLGGMEQDLSQKIEVVERPEEVK